MMTPRERREEIAFWKYFLSGIAGLVLVVAILLTTGCASLPAITIAVPPPSPSEPTSPAPLIDRGTLAFEVVDDAGAPIRLTLSLHTGEQGDTDANGYVKWDDIEMGPRHVVAHYWVDGPTTDTRVFEPFEFDAIFDTPQFQQRVVIRRVQTPSPPELHDLLINLQEIVAGFVTPSTLKPIATGWCVVNGDKRVADGAGFIHFPVSGSIRTAVCGADGYQARADAALYQLVFDKPNPVYLIRMAPPAPPKPAPKPTAPGAPIEACNARNNTGRISDGCLEAVTHGNLDYMSCANGDAVACHRYVRRVAAALRASTGDDGWGLITKFQGQGCTLTRCSQGLIPGEQKYGEDMVAYLPKGNPTNLWTGIDVIIGAGASGARYSGGVLPPAVGGRPDNLWAPVP